MTDYSELKRMAEAAIKYGSESGERWPQDDDWFEPERYGAELEYVKSVSPTAVLALIADLEEARNGMKISCAIRLKKEIERLERESDQLKAEVEALRSQVATLQSDANSWQSGYDEGRRMGTKTEMVEREQLRKDADRYRWLRVKQTFIWLIQDWFPRNNVLTDVDAEIDAAMGKEVKTK